LLPQLVGVIAERSGISRRNYRLGSFKDDGAATGTTND
jgi:hypothetical protein